jgi:hypothetical protein
MKKEIKYKIKLILYNRITLITSQEKWLIYESLFFNFYFFIANQGVFKKERNPFIKLVQPNKEFNITTASQQFLYRQSHDQRLNEITKEGNNDN